MCSVIERCKLLAEFTEEPGFITRTFRSQAMDQVHAQLRSWMEPAGMRVHIDPAGNLRARYPGDPPGERVLYIGSHLDTVPHAGAYDGVLGVVMGLALVEGLNRRRLKFEIEVIGFSEEEGVKFGVPYIGSRAFTGDLSAAAAQEFGLDGARIHQARAESNALGYFEFHIEQGPVLESMNQPLAAVQAIAGQTRSNLSFTGQANHAGTTPMHLRHDALTAAAEWIGGVERIARATDGLVATIGRLEIEPGAGNVIPGKVRASLDVRHACDDVRWQAVREMLDTAHRITAERGIRLSIEPRLEQCAVPMDPHLTSLLDVPTRLISGAGHDAAIVARCMPAAMLFLRSPGGISHHPDETVLPEDVCAALMVGHSFLERLETSLA